jgi:hypothetical protein
MDAFWTWLKSLLRRLTPGPPHPYRQRQARSVRLLPAIGAGIAASLLSLIVYYATLGLLPEVVMEPTTLFPVAAWAQRFDLAQFVGSLLLPPLPTPQTWVVGAVIFGGTLTALGVVYALLLSWGMLASDTRKGLGFGGALFVGLIFLVTLANGFHPAVMRHALPDTGLLLLGWSPLATGQILLTMLVYGATLGALYARWTPPAISRKPH